MKLNPQERHEQAIDSLKVLKSWGLYPDSPEARYWQRENDEAVAAYYGYKTVAELELAVETCWR